MHSFNLSLILVLTASLVASVLSHGFMAIPRCRGSLKTRSVFRQKPRHPKLKDTAFKDYSYLKDLPYNDCPHCDNGGGKGAVMKGANGKWTPYEPFNPDLPFRVDHGFCGDAAKGPRDHEAGGKWGFPKSPIVANYKPGQIVEFMVDITTNHNGWFEFLICDADKCGGDIGVSCFKKGHCHPLMREKTPVCESEQSKECAPVDDKYPGRWYIPCRKGDHVGEHFMGGPFMRYKLPNGFKTNHAVIQFYWATANSCNPPGFIDYFKRYPMKSWGKCPGDGGALGGRNPSIAECGGAAFPEEFWGCADVSVGGSGPAVSPGSPLPAPSMNPSVSNTPQPEMSTTPSSVPSPVQSLATNSGLATTTPQPEITPTPKSMTSDNEDDPKELTHRKGEGKNGECQVNWEQCGGVHYKGPKGGCCNKQFVCHRVHKYYSQCRHIKYINM